MWRHCIVEYFLKFRRREVIYCVPLFCQDSVTQHNYVECAVPCTSSSFFQLLNSIALCEYTTMCLTIHLLMDNLVISSFWQLQVKLLQTFLYRSLYKYRFFLFLLHISGGVERLMYGRCMFSFLKKLPNSFPKHFLSLPERLLFQMSPWYLTVFHFRYSARYARISDYFNLHVPKD